MDKDIDVVVEVLKVVEVFCIYIFIVIFVLYVEVKFKCLFDDVVEMVIYVVKCVRGYIDDVEFLCEDVGCIGIDNICCIVEVVIKVGVIMVNILDIVGYCLLI